MKQFRSAPSCILVGLSAMTAATLLYGQPGETPVASATTPASPPPHRMQSHVRRIGCRTARELIGKRVEARTGDALGKVNDVVVNPRTGRIVFVVLASGGFAGVGTQLRPVPPGALSQGWAKREILALDIIPKRWKTAPRMNKERLGNLENADTAKKIYTFYQQPWPATQTTNSASNSSDPVAPPTGRLKFASELIGESVLNDRHGEIGRVADLSMDLKDPAMTRAIVAPIDSQRKRFAIPLNAFGADAAGTVLFLKTDLRSFQLFQKAESPTTDQENSGA